MHDLSLWDVIDLPARLPGTEAEIGIFLVSKKQLVQEANLLDQRAPDEHARSRYRLYLVDFIFIQVGHQVAGKTAVLWKAAGQPAEIGNRIPGSCSAAAALLLQRA